MSAAVAHALTAERYAAQDAAWGAELWRRIREEGTCKVCGKHVPEANAQRFPGYCRRHRKRGEKLDRTVAAVVKHLDIKTEPEKRRKRSA